MNTNGFSDMLYRNAWARFATGIAVISSTEPNGSFHGMTANSVISVSLDPPLALVSIAHERNSYSYVKISGRFGLSILNENQKNVAEFFSLSVENRHKIQNFETSVLGDSSVITGALAAMDCRVTNEYVEGDHSLFIANVQNFEITDGDPLIWFDGQFGRFYSGGDVKTGF